MNANLLVLPIVLFLILLMLASAVRILQEYERGVVFRLGSALRQAKGPGLVLLIPFGIDRIVKVDMRVMTMDVPAQDVITRDNVSVKVNAVVYLKVVEPRKAVLEVDRYLYATSQLAQTTLRSVCGQKELDTLLMEREAINLALQNILDKQTDPWGVKVTLVELKQIDLPQEMQRAMAAQAEAERERRAKIIHAQGESEAARQLAEAAAQMEAHPAMLQLRYLQVLLEIGSEHNSTTVFPVPIDMFQMFMNSRPQRT
ncbi:MAG TPA: slipin family protein [Polyangiaceae bacterium]|jgi:regulator of protease activity HflC (stomatin/prohibitin superfamily)|nr:slipin family protein [Polyangiaceae bacterium]